MSRSSDLPEGVVDASPPGGFADGQTADAETVAQNADAAGSPLLSDAGSDAGDDEGDDEGDELDRPDEVVAADGPIESDEPGQVADPDLSPDTDTDTDTDGDAR